MPFRPHMDVYILMPLSHGLLETVALHEIGHLMGPHHRSVEGGIMWPTIRNYQGFACRRHCSH